MFGRHFQVKRVEKDEYFEYRKTNDGQKDEQMVGKRWRLSLEEG